MKNKEFIQKCDQLSESLGLEGNIIFTGKVAWGDMPYYYHVADVFVTASKTETQGLTIIEAMASNVVPVCMKDEVFQSMVTEDLCEESTKIEKAIEYIEKHTYHDTPKKLQNGIYERGELIVKNDFYIEDLVDILKGSDKE